MDKKYFECMTELGLEPGFTEKDLRKNWLELLKKYHPDKYQTEDDNTIDYDYEKYTDDYSENKFWDKFKKGAKKIGLKTTSYALILYYVLQKKEVPFKDKMLKNFFKLFYNFHCQISIQIKINKIPPNNEKKLLLINILQ